MVDVWASYDEDEEAYHIVIDGLVLYLNKTEVEEVVNELQVALMEGE